MERNQDLPEERTFVLPTAWTRSLAPWRGVLAVSTKAPAPDAGRDLAERIATFADFITEILDGATTDPELAEAGRAALRGESSPLGAAVLATALDDLATWDVRSRLPAFADGWVAGHGLEFAAEAVFLRAGLVATWAHVRPDTRHRYVRRAREGDWLRTYLLSELPHRIRALLAVSDEDTYRAVVELLRDREGTDLQRATAAFLLPTETAVVDECVTRLAARRGAAWPALSPHELLLCSISSVDQLRVLGYDSEPSMMLEGTTAVRTLAAVVGAELAPMLALRLDDEQLNTDALRIVLDALAALPTDEAFQILVDRADRKFVQPAIIAAAQRFPLRALRLLARAASGQSKIAALAGQLLTGIARANSDRLDALAAEERDAVHALAGLGTLLPEAPPNALPPLLVAPPWTRKQSASKPVVIDGLAPTVAPTIDWQPGERDDWARLPAYFRHRKPPRGWDRWIQAVRTGTLSYVDGDPSWLAIADKDVARSLLPSWRATNVYGSAQHASAVAARFGLDASPVMVQVAKLSPGSNAHLLGPYVTVEVAALMADWLVRSKSARPVARQWLRRHHANAARLLLPAALGKGKAARRVAETALRYLAGAGFADDVRAAAAEHGDAAATAVEAMLAVDPLDIVPAKVPTVPAWADPSQLPQLALADRATALPAASAGHVLTMAALSKPDDPYAGVEVVREVCDPRSLAEFGWALFARWQAAGMPSKEGWVLSAQAWLGDDETVRELTPLVRAWPAEGGFSKAVAALDVFVGIGSDVALMHLHGLSQKVKSRNLRGKAQEKIAEVAEDLNLTPDELADRLVPTFGLDDEASLTLDYGPRTFVIGFDEQLKPFVIDDTGARRKDLPKPGAKDDPDRAPAEHQRFAALKKDVRTVAADQILRLERAMVDQRRWDAVTFRRLFVGHPLLWHIVRRLVWITDDGVAFRVAEDRTLADVADDEFTLPDNATVGIGHPVLLGGAVPAWAELFADYEILQPFPQLGRPVFELTDAERRANRLARFEGGKVGVGKVLGLQRRGWERGEPQDAGVEGWISRPLPDDRAVVISLDPGIVAGAPDTFAELKLESIWLNNAPGGNWAPPKLNPPTFGDLDPVLASEVLANLVELTS